MSGKNRQFYEFGNFRLDAEHPSLWRRDELAPLSPKALELLILLVERRGGIVSREELLETIWKGTFVEEANINYTVSVLRKTLDIEDKGHFIQTLPKRGYRFVADVRRVSDKPVSSESLAHEAPNAQVGWHLIVVILAGLFFLTSFGVWWKATKGEVPLTRRNIKTVAILPFKYLSENEQNKALSLGLTDTLISRLGSLNLFTVRPFDAVEKYTRSEKDAIKFGEELKVDAILEGTFQTADNRFRVNVRLWDVRDGAQIWQDSFDETEAGIFALQDKLSASVAKSLMAELTPENARILGKSYTENADAYRAYARGRDILEQRKVGRIEKAIEQFQIAIDLDPTFALAYTGFADAYASQGAQLPGAESVEAFKKAKLYAEKAVELDAESAESLTSLAVIKYHHEWDWMGAESDFVRAIKLNPNYARAYQRYAHLLTTLGRHDEALANIKKASEINPISRRIVMMHFPVLEARGDYDEALKMAQDFYRFDKDFPDARIALGTFLYHKGEFAKVIEFGEESLKKQAEMPAEAVVTFRWFSLLTASYRRIGRISESSEMLARLEEMAQQDTRALYSLAVNYAELGRTRDAISALQNCLERREERMVMLKVEPRFADLRNEVRFKEILTRMNL